MRGNQGVFLLALVLQSVQARQLLSDGLLPPVAVPLDFDLCSGADCIPITYRFISALSEDSAGAARFYPARNSYANQRRFSTLPVIRDPVQRRQPIDQHEQVCRQLRLGDGMFVVKGGSQCVGTMVIL